MIIQFLDYNTKKIEFTHDCIAVPMKGDNIQHQHSWDHENNRANIDDYRVLSVSHLFMGYNHNIIVMICDHQTYLEQEYGSLARG